MLEGAALIGIIGLRDVRGVPRPLWSSRRVRNVMRAASEDAVVQPDAELLSAMRMMADEDVDFLPVVADGRLEGTISQQDIMARLRVRSELGVHPSDGAG